MTDLLYLCHAHIKYGVPFDTIFELIEKKYRTIKEDLHLSIDLDREIDTIRKKW
ncbi:hypothetical protein HMPREF9466_00076 [Fusobacterium necrophorum subsp. funduliforme 1_1_36S]|nr:hypothetical protein HMPREF9466_00076 [Fusobacterium necrophorum subsp. funduliforme 1_1_36S]